jgi:hypothetical protein
MIQHTEDCNDLMTGRALRQLIDQDLRIRSISLAELNSRRDMMRAHEAEGRCDCARLALGRVSTELTTVRKRKASLQGARSVSGDVEANLARESELLAMRDELRAIIAGAR